MTKKNVIERQIVDWSAAVWAGVIAGIVFLVANFIASAVAQDNADVTIRLVASLVLGSGVLFDEPTVGVILVGIVVHFILSILFALLIAIVIHRWGLIVGIVGGGLLGLALYIINFFALSAIFPWFYAVTGWVMALSHILFGAVAGGAYEALEVEEFVEIEI